MDLFDPNPGKPPKIELAYPEIALNACPSLSQLNIYIPNKQGMF